MDKNTQKRFELAKKHVMVIKVTENWGHTKAMVGEYELKNMDLIEIEFPDGSFSKRFVYLAPLTRDIHDMGNSYQVHDAVPYIKIEYGGLSLPVRLDHLNGLKVANILPHQDSK